MEKEKKNQYMREYRLRNLEKVRKYSRDYMRKVRNSLPKRYLIKEIKPIEIKIKKVKIVYKKPKVKKLSEKEQQKEARERIGLPAGRGKSYAEYVKDASKRKKEDKVYKSFLNKKYKPDFGSFESFETLQGKELSEE